MASSRQLLDRLELFGTRLGLESTRRLLTGTGEPQERMGVVLIAGTNGKGSTAALLSSMATAAGYRTGLYTSPHLETVHERVRVDGVAISESRLAACLEEVLSAREPGTEPVTYFEGLTVAALIHFAREEVELAVLEVGLGGRLDATNATSPLLSVVTEIGIDHRRHLGETIGEIAFEKAGILRNGRPAVAWVTDSEARHRLTEVASDLGASLRFASDDCAMDPSAGGGVVTVTTAVARHKLTPTLRGSHQLANLGLAVSAAETLAADGWTRLDARAIRMGVAGSRWPGRLEWVEPDGAPRLLLDAAHNPHGAAALAAHLETESIDYTLVFGALQDKQVDEMLPALARRAGRIVLTAPGSPRALDPGTLAGCLPSRKVEVAPDVARALTAALGTSAPIVVCGSLYLVGEARAELTRRFGVPTPAAELSTYDPTVSATSSGG